MSDSRVPCPANVLIPAVLNGCGAIPDLGSTARNGSERPSLWRDHRTPSVRTPSGCRSHRAPAVRTVARV